MGFDVKKNCPELGAKQGRSQAVAHVALDVNRGDARSAKNLLLALRGGF